MARDRGFDGDSLTVREAAAFLGIPLVELYWLLARGFYPEGLGSAGQTRLSRSAIESEMVPRVEAAADLEMGWREWVHRETGKVGCAAPEVGTASAAALGEMKVRGFDPATIERERARLEHLEDGLELIPVIEAAFEGVVLGEGIGLREARGRDDYEDDEVLMNYRALDEREDWRRLSAEVLNAFQDTLTFMDDLGARFHLPAFMVCELRGEFRFGFADSLGMDSVMGEARYGLLSREQRIAVRLFLLHAVVAPDAFDEESIRYGLEHYWVWPAEG